MSDERTCPICGARVAGEARFCPNGCGALPPPAEKGSERPAPPCAPMPLTLDFCAPEAFLAGEYALLRFRLTAREDVFSSVTVLIKNGLEEIRRVALPGRPGTRTHELAINLRPQHAGELALGLEVVCRREGSVFDETYGASLPVFVESQAGTFAPTFNITQNLSADRASDIHPGSINVNGLANVVPVRETARYRSDGRTFRPLPLQLVASPKCLTLVSDQGAVHLLALGEVTFGRRTPDCTIALACCDAQGRRDLGRSGMLSRRHFRLTLDETACRIEDIGSTFGTALDGQRLAANEPRRLKGACDHRLVLCPGADPTLPEGALAFTVHVFANRLGLPTGCRLERDGLPRESVIVLNRAHIPVGADGARIGWNGCTFDITPPDEPPQTLVPGQSLVLDGTRYQIEIFHQTTHLT